MKKYITLIVLVFSFTVSANNRSIHFVNTTPNNFDFALLTTTDDDFFSYPMYSMTSYMSIAAFSDALYEDPVPTPGIPYYLFTPKWYYITATGYTSVTANTAFINSGSTQKWGGMKFRMPAVSGFSGEIGPYLGTYSFTAGGFTVTWVPTATRVTVFIS